MTQRQKWTYPIVRRDESLTEDHFGTNVADPYRWLEDPDGEETREFVAAQNEITQPYLEACEVRDKFKDRCDSVRKKHTHVHSRVHKSTLTRVKTRALACVHK